MRVFTLALFILTALPTCFAQSDQAQAEAVIKQMERAEQTGDFNTWISLWTREKSAEMEKMRPYAKARPDVQYRVTKSFVRGEEAVVFVQTPSYPSNPFITIKLRREGGQWKIQDELFRETAQDGNSVSALLPPAGGAFARAGSPWDQVAPATYTSPALHRGWQMKAVFDESHLYIRIETDAALPAPGSTIETPPGGWPVLKIDTSDAGEFVLYDAVNIGDHATFDQSGKANSHRHFAAYMIRLERNKQEVFSASADLTPSPLLNVSGRDYDIRIPLAAMGITDSRATRINVGDAQWPKSAVVSIAVQRYPR